MEQYKGKIIIKILEDYFECHKNEIVELTQKNDTIKIIIDDSEIRYEKYLSIYLYGVLLKEFIEDYAQSIGLKGVWIDLNDLSKDEGYYFRHCNEVYQGLFDYELKVNK